MKIINSALFACLIALSCASAFADNLSASADSPKTIGVLLSWCNGGVINDPVSQFKEISCVGYLQGVLDTTSVIFGVRPDAKFFCPPEEGISADQLLGILNEYVERNPNFLNESTRMTVLIAYGKAFPCSIAPVQP